MSARDATDAGVRGLGIAEVAARTGLGVPLLRAWETRFGFPSPARLPNGRRAYSERDVELLLQVVRDRAGGLSLPAAVELAAEAGVEPEGSIFAGLRRRRSDLDAWLLSKRTLLNMSRAIEDEYCARGEPAVLIATFQREEFYRRAERRWRDLARTAHLAIVLADFPRSPEAPGRPDRAAAAERGGGQPRMDADLRRAGVLRVPGGVGARRPGVRTGRGAQVRDALERRARGRARGHPGGAEIALRAAPDLAERFPARLDRAPHPAPPEVRTLVALTGRMIGYAERAGA